MYFWLRGPSTSGARPTNRPARLSQGSSYDEPTRLPRAGRMATGGSAWGASRTRCALYPVGEDDARERVVLAQIVQVVGSLLVLAGFAAAQRGLLDQKSRRYLVLNLVGSTILAVDAVFERQWGFLAQHPRPRRRSVSGGSLRPTRGRRIWNTNLDRRAYQACLDRRDYR